MPVPPRDVEGVVAVEAARDAAPRRHAHLEFARLVVRLERVGGPDVAFGPGRALEELPAAIAVPRGRLDVPAGRLDDEHPLVAARVGKQPPEHAGRQHQVVAGPVAQRAELALHDARALVHEEQLVAVGAAAPPRHRLDGPDDRDAEVGVGQQRHPAPDGIARRGQPRRGQQPVAQRAGRLETDVVGAGVGEPLDRGGRTQVVEQRLDAREAVKAHQFFVVQRPVGLAELRVALGGHAAPPQVVAHDAASTRLPRRACSRSMASKSDLKFPSPNPFDPRRSMTSKNSVGRS